MKRKDLLVVTVCAVIIVAGLSWVVWRFTRGGGSIDRVHVYAGAALPEDGKFRVPVTLRNESDRTVSSVGVEVILWRGDEQVEKEATSFSLVGPFQEAQSSVTLENDPKCCSVVARAVAE